MNSERLRRYVLDELAFDPRIDAGGVSVAVQDRIVTLTGHVRSLADRSAIAEAVDRVKGVRGVVLEIDVKCPPECHVPDDEIARRAASVLAWNTMLLPQDAVKVAVENGFLTLSGYVDWQFQRSQIENDMRCLSGVNGIRNDIAIRRASKAQDIKRAIQDAMRRRADMLSARIRVGVDDAGHVTLEGRAEDWRERNMVEDAAWMVAGVRDVDNRVRVR